MARKRGYSRAIVAVGKERGQPPRRVRKQPPPPQQPARRTAPIRCAHKYNQGGPRRRRGAAMRDNPAAMEKPRSPTSILESAAAAVALVVTARLIASTGV